MAEVPGTPPEPSRSFGRRGRGALFSLHVEGHPGASLVMAVEHRDPEDPDWSEAGSVSAAGTCASTLRVSDLKQELRLRFAHGGDPTGGVLRVHVAPPLWLED